MPPPIACATTSDQICRRRAGHTRADTKGIRAHGRVILASDMYSVSIAFWLVCSIRSPLWLTYCCAHLKLRTEFLSPDQFLREGSVNLKAVAAAIAQDFTRRARRMRLANLFLKFVLIALTAVAAAIQFFTTSPWTYVNYWGVAACIGIALCGYLFLVFRSGCGERAGALAQSD